jgi:hypothetical protein
MFEAFPLTLNPWLPVGVLWSTFLLIPKSQLPPATRLPVPNPARIELLGSTGGLVCDSTFSTLNYLFAAFAQSPALIIVILFKGMCLRMALRICSGESAWILFSTSASHANVRSRNK